MVLGVCLGMSFFEDVVESLTGGGGGGGLCRGC